MQKDLNTIQYLSTCPWVTICSGWLWMLMHYTYHCSFLLFCRHLGLDLVPRKDFEVVDSDQISVSDLYKMVRNPWDIPVSFHFGRERRGKNYFVLHIMSWLQWRGKLSIGFFNMFFIYTLTMRIVSVSSTLSSF